MGFTRGYDRSKARKRRNDLVREPTEPQISTRHGNNRWLVREVMHVKAITKAISQINTLNASKHKYTNVPQHISVPRKWKFRVLEMLPMWLLFYSHHPARILPQSRHMQRPRYMQPKLHCCSDYMERFQKFEESIQVKNQKWQNQSTEIQHFRWKLLIR